MSRGQALSIAPARIRITRREWLALHRIAFDRELRTPDLIAMALRQVHPEITERQT